MAPSSQLFTALAMLIEDQRDQRNTHLAPRVAGQLITRGLARWVSGTMYTITEHGHTAYTTGRIPKTRSCHGVTWARVRGGQWSAYLPKGTFTITLADDKTHWTLHRDDHLMRRIHTRPAEEAADIASIDVHLWIANNTTQGP